MWAMYALGAAILTSFLPIINKRLLANAEVAVVAWAVNTLSLAILGIATYWLVPSPRIDLIFLTAILGSGVLNAVATLLSTRSLAIADASLVTPFLTLNPVFTLLVAVFTLREVPDAFGVAGVLVIAVGAYLFAVEQVGAGWTAPIVALLNQRGKSLARRLYYDACHVVTAFAGVIQSRRHTDPTDLSLSRRLPAGGCHCRNCPALWLYRHRTRSGRLRRRPLQAQHRLYGYTGPLFAPRDRDPAAPARIKRYGCGLASADILKSGSVRNLGRAQRDKQRAEDLPPLSPPHGTQFEAI